MTASWKTWLWRTAIAVAIIIVIAAGFYAEENARGIKAWTDCKRQLEAQGENLDWTNYIPAPVPDDQNFFKSPMMTEWFVRNLANNFTNDLYLRLQNPETTSVITTETAASNYLAWCAAFDPDFDKIRDALKRPRFRMDGDYLESFGMPYPNFINVRLVAQTLAQRAKCQLLLGDPEKAMSDLTLLHDFSRMLGSNSSTKSSTIVSAMILVAVTGLYTDVVADGTMSHAWSEPQLAVLQKQLQAISLLPVLAESLRAERAALCHTIATVSLEQTLRTTGSPKTVSDFGWWLMPGGWVYQNMAVIATVEQKPIECFDLTNHLVLPYKVEAASFSTRQTFQHITPWNYLAAMTVPSFSKAIEIAARNQAWVDQAQIVCALERFRLANGKYPDTLAALVPQFIAKLPHDIISGKPLIYSCKDGQDFLLYSVGWNQADDGGIRAYASDGKEDRESGDWVWHYPTQ